MKLNEVFDEIELYMKDNDVWGQGFFYIYPTTDYSQYNWTYSIEEMTDEQANMSDFGVIIKVPEFNESEFVENNLTDFIADYLFEAAQEFQRQQKRRSTGGKNATGEKKRRGGSEYYRKIAEKRWGGKK